MGVINKPRKVHIQTGRDSNSEQSSAPPSDVESGYTTPRAQVAAQDVASSNTRGFNPTALSRHVGYRLKMKKGARANRRVENERLLMSMYGFDSLDADESQDVNQPTYSYFTDLMDEQNREILEEFINNEETKYFNLQEEDEEDNENEEDVEEKEAKFQAEEAFLRISGRLRAALKKNVPLGMLRGIEESLNENFSKNPESEFVLALSSYERLLVHALSAYNCLNSYSFDQNGQRLVRVENPRRQFFKKDPTLTDYVAIRNNLDK